MQHEFHSFTVAQLDVSELIKKQSIKKAPKMIKNLIVDIKCRNKLIKPADKLPGGWKNVDEYVPDSLGSNSEGERNIKSAEATALKKQRISTNTDSDFSRSTKRFRNVQENTEFQVRRSPGYTIFHIRKSRSLEKRLPQYQT